VIAVDDTIEKRELFFMQQICLTLLSLAKKLDREDNKYSKGLTASQYMTIRAIRHSPQGKTTLINIAQKLGTTKQNINRMIPALEKKGYISGAAGRKHKRLADIKVTDLGLDAMLEYAETGASVMMDIFNDFTENEMETLLHLLQKLHRYDGMNDANFITDIISLLEREYSDLLAKILEEYKKRKS